MSKTQRPLVFIACTSQSITSGPASLASIADRRNSHFSAQNTFSLSPKPATEQCQFQKNNQGRQRKYCSEYSSHTQPKCKVCCFPVFLLTFTSIYKVEVAVCISLHFPLRCVLKCLFSAVSTECVCTVLHVLVLTFDNSAPGCSLS